MIFVITHFGIDSGIMIPIAFRDKSKAEQWIEDKLPDPSIESYVITEVELQ